MVENASAQGLLSFLQNVIALSNQQKQDLDNERQSPVRRASESYLFTGISPLSSIHSSFTKSGSIDATPIWRKGSLECSSVNFFVPEVSNPRKGLVSTPPTGAAGVKNEDADYKMKTINLFAKAAKEIESCKKEENSSSGKDGLSDRSTEEDNDTLTSAIPKTAKISEDLSMAEPTRRSTRQRQMGVLRKRLKDFSSSEDEEENIVIDEDTEKSLNCATYKKFKNESQRCQRTDKEFPILHLLEIVKPKIKKRVETRERSGSRSHSKKKAQNFKCPIEACFKKFRTGQALGGHMSRAHPNQSTDYKVKQTIRERRTLDRIILKKAKEQYVTRFGDISSVNRCRLKRIKDSIVDDSKAMLKLRSLADEEMNHKLKKKKTGANSE